jgi:hypothetical protein
MLKRIDKAAINYVQALSEKWPRKQGLKMIMGILYQVMETERQN